MIAANLLTWSLQVAAIAAAASLLPWLFRLDAAGVRYAYWRTVAALCLALPWLQPYHDSRLARGSANAAVMATTAVAAPLHAAGIPVMNWELLFVVALAAGIVARLCWLGMGLVRLRSVRQNASHGPSEAAHELQRALGTRAEIRYAPQIEQPITFGVLRPIVALPQHLRCQSTDVQDAVLGHELLHVKRRDWAWLIAEEIAVCLFWFHPASWWVASQIQHAREEVVDELTIQLTGRRKAYVQALLAFSDRISVVPTAAFARRRHLFRRIALVSKETVMSSRQIVATCAAMALIVGTGSWYATAAFPFHAPQGQTDAQGAPGPLERKAHAVTPENPIPRRIHFEGPVLPDSLPSTRGTVGVQVTLDDVGRVAEARVVELTLSGPDYSVSLSGGIEIKSQSSMEQKMNVLDPVVASVRQWRYDPPAQAPLTFVVKVPVKNGPEVMEFKPAPGGSAGGGTFRRDDALRVGGNIKTPKKIKDVPAVYPPIASQAGVQGVVIVEVRIGTDGLVEEAHVLRSIPLLDQAALDAVKQWQFEPTLMNGAPIPVIMTVTINFAQ